MYQTPLKIYENEVGDCQVQKWEKDVMDSQWSDNANRINHSAKDQDIVFD